MAITEIRPGVFLRHHEKEDCTPPCSIHSPSDHNMREFPLYWRSDRGLMERICPHGWGHPDPDHMQFLRSVRPKDAEWEGVHGCDGCCSGIKFD